MPRVDVVIPVLNEEAGLPACLDTLLGFLPGALPGWEAQVVVADNGSTDGTLALAQRYATEHPGRVAATHLPVRGRGRALRKAWMESDADVVSYMDVDLSTGLEAFPALVEAVGPGGGSHVATGSRLARGARTTRSLKREVISRVYNLLIKALLWTRFSDAQCGFKALSRDAARVLVPLVRDEAWFFDTELLVIAEKRGFKVKDIPVTWREDPDSRVKIVKTVLEDLRGLARLRFGGIPPVSPPPLV